MTTTELCLSLGYIVLAMGVAAAYWRLLSSKRRAAPNVKSSEEWHHANATLDRALNELDALRKELAESKRILDSARDELRNARQALAHISLLANTHSSRHVRTGPDSPDIHL